MLNFNYKKFIGAVLMVVVIGALGVLWQKPGRIMGSVPVTGEYNATTTVGMGTGAFRVIKSSAGTLGSVVISSSSASTFKVWNATSTIDAASSSPVQFAASASHGTYTYDADFNRGIILELPTGFTGSYTITWR